MNSQLLSDLNKFRPELILAAAVLCTVLAEIFLSRLRRPLTFAIAALGLALAGLACIPLFRLPGGALFYGVVAVDPMAAFFKIFLILAAFLVLLAAPGARELSRRSLGEFYVLLLSVTLAMTILASSTDMLMMYLALEMVSIGSYLMVGYLKNDRGSNEAALKYLLFGAVASGCMLYGLSILYGLCGTTQIAGMRVILSAGGGAGNTAMLFLASVLTLAGFGFKTAAVPFHFWCPDVYSGAPTPVTAFLSVAPKTAGFAILVRFLFTGLSIRNAEAVWTPIQSINWSFLLLAISVATMTLGNIAALRQTDMKRLLAYSSIAHAGYIFMGIVVLTAQGLQAVLIYLITYLFMNLGAFLVVIEIHNQTGSFDLKAYRGLHRRSPFLTIAMTLFMFSLMGIPPFAGFFGKLYVFGAVVNGNLAWFAVIGALNSVVSVFYYARVIRAMILEPAEEPVPRISLPWMSHVLVWLMFLPTAGLALFWGQIERLTTYSIKLFVG